MAVVKYARGTNTTIFTTELNSLANNSLVVSSAISFSETAYTLCEVELSITFDVAPTANTGISIWFLREVDGTNYEDGSTSITPTRTPDLVLPIRAVTTAQRVIGQTMAIPGSPKILIKNDGTGQAFASSSNTLKIRPLTLQTV